MISHRPQLNVNRKDLTVHGTGNANSSLTHTFRRKVNWDKLAEAQKQSGIYKLLLLFDECLHLSGRDGNGVVAKTSSSRHDDPPRTTSIKR